MFHILFDNLGLVLIILPNPLADIKTRHDLQFHFNKYFIHILLVDNSLVYKIIIMRSYI